MELVSGQIVSIYHHACCFHFFPDTLLQRNCILATLVSEYRFLRFSASLVCVWYLVGSACTEENFFDNIIKLN
jgi:hypothetical protein